jgi:hypothetical protein
MMYYIAEILHYIYRFKCKRKRIPFYFPLNNLLKKYLKLCLNPFLNFMSLRCKFD